MEQESDFEFKLVSDIDLERCAHLLIRQHGDSAWKYADAKMMELISQDDAKGAAVWMTISHKVDLFLRKRKAGNHLSLCTNNKEAH